MAWGLNHEGVIMPLATKDSPARPFDVTDAIRRAARCRALRQTVGLTVDDLARAVNVRGRSINRWESSNGEGSTPDDVLTLLASLLDEQRTLAATVADACVAPGDRDGDGLPPHPRAIDPAIIGPMIQDLITNNSTTAKNRSKIDNNCSNDYQNSNDNSLVKGVSMPNIRAYIRDVSMSYNTSHDTSHDGARTLVLYYPSQSTLDAIHPKMGVPVGVVNTTARMIADELDRAGIDAEWRYASAE